MNLYGFVGNDGVNWWDVLGLSPFETAEEAIEAMRGALVKAHEESVAEGHREINMRTGEPGFWHNLKSGSGNNHTSLRAKGHKQIRIVVVLGKEFGAEAYCFDVGGVKKYDYSTELRKGNMPTVNDVRNGNYGELNTPTDYYRNKEYAPEDRRATVDLIAEAHTHPEVWKLWLTGEPNLHPKIDKTVGPSNEDKRAAFMIEEATGDKDMIHEVYDNEKKGRIFGDYIWYQYEPLDGN